MYDLVDGLISFSWNTADVAVGVKAWRRGREGVGAGLIGGKALQFVPNGGIMDDGEGAVSSDVLVKICTALECTLDDIVEIVPDNK